MNLQEYLLTQLAEEASEIIQMACKVKRFGKDEVYKKNRNKKTNEERLCIEVNDLFAILELLNVRCGLSKLSYDRDLVVAKRRKVDKYLEHSKSLGTLSNA